VGLTILNLNQFAQYVSKAEALIDEITRICKDMPEIHLLRLGTPKEMRERRGTPQTTRKKLMYTPSLT